MFIQNPGRVEYLKESAFKTTQERVFKEHLLSHVNVVG